MGRHWNQTRLRYNSYTKINKKCVIFPILAVDAFIFFANARPGYIWTYFLNTVVYSYYKVEKKETAVVFWDLTTNETITKIVKDLRFLSSNGDISAIVLAEKLKYSAFSASNTSNMPSSPSKEEKDSLDDSGDYSAAAKQSPQATKKADELVYSVQLRDSIGH
jgi:hypothetical protein